MQRSTPFIVSLGGMAALLAGLNPGCSSSDVTSEQLPPVTSQGGAGGATATGGGYALGGGPAGCDPACVDPKFCSVTGSCLAQGTCAATGDCSIVGTVCDVDAGLCAPGGNCGAVDFPISLLPPNIMLVVDRTGSMADEVPQSGGKSRWEVAKEAVATVLDGYGGKVNFGLVVFSACTDQGCMPGQIVEPLGSDPATINAALASTDLCDTAYSETVIGGTLQALVGDPTLQDAGRDNAILLLTDGQDNCGGGGPEAAAALVAEPVPVKTYVVGFSGDVDATELGNIAQSAGTSPYYQADDPAQLDAALHAVASSVASCSYSLVNPPAQAMFVFFNNDPAGVPGDASDGWTLDLATGTLTFNGSYCTAIETGQVHDIDVVFGCDLPTPD